MTAKTAQRILKVNDRLLWSLIIIVGLIAGFAILNYTRDTESKIIWLTIIVIPWVLLLYVNYPNSSPEKTERIIRKRFFISNGHRIPLSGETIKKIKEENRNLCRNKAEHRWMIINGKPPNTIYTIEIGNGYYLVCINNIYIDSMINANIITIEINETAFAS